MEKLIHPLFFKAKSKASKKTIPAGNKQGAVHLPTSFGRLLWRSMRCHKAKAREIVDCPLPNITVLDILWAFKIKWFPDGLIKGFKGQLCAIGDQQVEGVDFFETYALVMQWATIWLVLILEVLLGLRSSKQGDMLEPFSMLMLARMKKSLSRCWLDSASLVRCWS